MEEERIREIVREEIANTLPKKRSKGDRGPNKWQLFLKNCTKNQSEELGFGEKVKLCSIEYKDAKEKGILDNLLSQNSQTSKHQLNQKNREMNQEV